MIDFYYKYFFPKFRRKSQSLADELEYILNAENIRIEYTNEEHVSHKYKKNLGDTLFKKLNGIYYSLRKNNCENHYLLKNYLPETKKIPSTGLLFADFFCGAGGLSQGFIDADFTPVFANDNYTEGLETYYFNHSLSSERIFNGDIKKIVEDYSFFRHFFKNIKIIIGGPPCQGFSMANRWNFEYIGVTKSKRFIEDERNILYKYFVKLLGLIKPDFFLIENVMGMAKVENQIEQDIQNESEIKYYYVPLILNAKNFGIPQNRIRYFLIGGKDKKYLEKIKTNILEEESPDIKYKLNDALYGLPSIKSNPIKRNTEYENGENGYIIIKKDTPQNDFLKIINRNKSVPYILNHKSRYNNTNDLNIFRLLPQGGNSLDNSIINLNNYKNRNHIFKDKYYKLKPNEVCKTITSHMKYDCNMYIHPNQARGLSPREAARAQTFSDNYFFRGTLNDWYKQIGNAVPVRLANIIAEQIKNYYK